MNRMAHDTDTIDYTLVTKLNATVASTFWGISAVVGRVLLGFWLGSWSYLLGLFGLLGRTRRTMAISKILWRDGRSAA